MDDTLPRVTTVTVGSGLRERAEKARYPALFTPPHASSPRPGYQRIERRGTGIVAISALHGNLSVIEVDAIAEYRLQQYVLSDMYDEHTVETLGVRRDPAIDLLSDRDIHIAVGDTEGRFLCYLCMQSPVLSDDPGEAASTPTWLMRDIYRPCFPVESEYGFSVYGKHPFIGPAPVNTVRELTRFVRNQVLRTPWTACTIVEAVLAGVRVMCDPVNQMEVIVGCASSEARRLLYRLGIPMMYAPEAPIVGDNLGAELEGHLLWSDKAHVPGRFWPFALAIDDLRRAGAYFEQLDSALGLPTNEIVEALAALRPKSLLGPPSLLVPREQAGDVLWIDQPIRSST